MWRDEKSGHNGYEIKIAGIPKMDRVCKWYKWIMR